MSLQNNFSLNNTQIFQLAKLSKTYALSVLSSEKLFEQLSFEQVLTIIGAHESIALDYLKQEKHWQYLDGHALSIMAEKSENVALFVIKEPQLRELLVGLDLARIGQASTLVALTILKDELLRSKLKSVHYAMLGENHPQAGNFIVENKAIFKELDPNDFGKLCKNNYLLACTFLKNHDLIKNVDGSILALMAEFHDDLIQMLLTEPQYYNKRDLNAFVILGRNNENAANQIFETFRSSYQQHLGILGIARMAKYHEKLAFRVLDDEELMSEFSGACFEQLAQIHENVAVYIYKKYKDELSLDELVMIGKNHLPVAELLLKDPKLSPQLTGKHLVSLGTHLPIASLILENETLRQKVKRKHVGLLGLRDFEIAKSIMQDSELKESLLQLDLANLCKQFLLVTKLTLFSPSLESKVSTEYFQLLKQRMNLVISISDFVQKNNSYTVIDEMSELPISLSSLPLFSMATARVIPLKTAPIPEGDRDFERKFQSNFF